MGTTADKLNAILASKEAIRKAIVAQGVSCDTLVPLADYAEKIGRIMMNRSFWVDTDGINHPMTAANTPLSNLSNITSSVVIEGVSVDKNRIKEIYFGSDYLNEDILPNNFIFTFSRLSNIGLWGLRNVSRIMNYFAQSALLNDNLAINISYLSNISSIGVNFMFQCYAIKTIQIGSLDFSKIAVGTDGFKNVQNVPTSVIYADTLALGDAFKAKFPNISNWTVVINP